MRALTVGTLAGAGRDVVQFSGSARRRAKKGWITDVAVQARAKRKTVGRAKNL